MLCVANDALVHLSNVKAWALDVINVDLKSIPGVYHRHIYAHVPLEERHPDDLSSAAHNVAVLLQCGGPNHRGAAPAMPTPGEPIVVGANQPLEITTEGLPDVIGSWRNALGLSHGEQVHARSRADTSWESVRTMLKGSLHTLPDLAHMQRGGLFDVSYAVAQQIVDEATTETTTEGGRIGICTIPAAANGIMDRIHRYSADRQGDCVCQHAPEWPRW